MVILKLLIIAVFAASANICNILELTAACAFVQYTFGQSSYTTLLSTEICLDLHPQLYELFNKYH